MRWVLRAVAADIVQPRRLSVLAGSHLEVEAQMGVTLLPS